MLKPQIKNGWIWISTKNFTVRIEIRNGVIVDSAPIVKKFIKQRVTNLYNWLLIKFKDFQWIEYKEGE